MNLRPSTDVDSSGAVDAPHRSALLTLLFTDVVDSVKLKEDHGDRRALRLLERHDALVRRLLGTFEGAWEAQVAGDSFFLVFPRPSEAVSFSLQFQRELRALSTEEGVPIQDRIGIHVGEVLLTEEGPKARPIGGLQIDTCARLMSLGLGDQILVSRFVFDSTRQAFRGEIVEEFGSLAWLNHGLYEFKGIGDPMEVFEIGEMGLARLAPPPSSAKVYRVANADGESVHGWRPAPGVNVPGTSWNLDRCLGEGGFGEVWLAHHRLLKEARVFKFCFHLDRVRSLKREITLLRILREHVGEHPGIVRLHDVFLDEPPYYLAMDYVSGGSLTDWAVEQGGLVKVPLEQRLEIAIQVAEALAAAHDAGVIHRDVKPGNVLMSGSVKGKLHVQLSDFGIGQISRDATDISVTQLGFTRTLTDAVSGTGTHQYMAPELLMGKQATVRSDVYSLGVLLLQLVIGDLQRPITGDWQEDIEDPLLREDLRKCLASDPARRWSSANQLAARLRALPKRREDLQQEQVRLAAAERRAYRRGVLRSAMVASVVVLLLAGLAGVALDQSRKTQHHANAEKAERTRAEGALTRMQLQRADELLRTGEARDGIAYLAHVVRRDPTHRGAAARLLSELTDRTHPRPITPPMKQPGMVLDVAFRPDGKQLASTGRNGTQIWDAETGVPIGDLIPFGGFRVAWSPDGFRLAIMSFNARIYDVRTRHQVMTLDCNPANGGGTGRPEMLIDPEWRIAVTAAADDSVEAWDLSNGQRIGSSMQHGSEVLAIAFDPVQQRILTGCADGGVHLWAISENRKLHSFEITGRIEKVTFHPDGKHVLAGSSDGTVAIWDSLTGSSAAESLKHGDQISEVRFTPDGGTLLVADQGGHCRFYNAATFKPSGKNLDEAYRIFGAQFTADGLRAFTRTAEGLVRLWDVELRREDSVAIQPDGFPYASCFSPDGRRVATGCSDGRVQVWAIDERAAEPLLLPHGAPIWQFAVQPGADRVATAGADGRVQVWDLATGKPTISPIIHGGGVQRVRMQRDGKMITTGTDNFVRAWDPEGKPLGKPIYLDASASAAELMPNGKELLLAPQGGTASLWNLTTGERGTARLGKAVSSAMLSPDGHRILVADDTRGLLHDTTGTLVAASIEHRSKIAQALFSPSGRLIATGSYDASAQIWDGETGARLGPEMRHANVIAALTWSSDEKLLATTSYDTAVYIWDTSRGSQVGAPLIHPQMVSQIVFSPAHPKLLLTGSIDGCVRLWDLETRTIIAADWKVPGKVQAIGWDNSGSRVIALGENADALCVWLVPRLPEGSTTWLADWAEAAGRRQLAEDGSLLNVPFEEVMAKRAALSQIAKSGDAPVALQWAFGDNAQATLAPDSLVAVQEYSRALAGSTSFAARSQARSLAPADGSVWTEHLLTTLRQTPTLSPRQTRLFDFQSRHALALTSSKEPRAWLARSLALDAQGRGEEAKTALQRGLEINPSAPGLLHRKAQRATAAGDHAAAAAICGEALKGAADDTTLRRAILLDRSAAYRNLGNFAEAGADNVLARNLPTRRREATARQLDLSAFYNSRLDEDRIPQDRDNTLTDLLPGIHTLAGTTFDVRGVVQFGNDGVLNNFPREVRGIPVGARYEQLHFLQAAAFVTELGETPLAELIVHYEDGLQEVVRQVNGHELADWWTTDPEPPLVAAWRGSSPFSRAKGRALCLFKASWKNPRPEVAIRSLDYVSIAKSAAPFVVAITAE